MIGVIDGTTLFNNLFCFRVTKTADNLFVERNYDNLEPWKNNFRFCSCQQEGDQYVTTNLKCDEPSTDLKQVCLENLPDDSTVRCDLAKRKRRSVTDTHKSPATRKALNEVSVITIE